MSAVLLQLLATPSTVDHTSFQHTWGRMKLWRRFLCPVQPMQNSLSTLFISVLTRFVLATYRRTHSLAALNYRLLSPSAFKPVSAITQARRFRKQAKPDVVIKGRRIAAAQMIVIDEDGSNLGLMDKRAALKLAEEKHLELVQVHKGREEVVCRLKSNKELYEENKNKAKKDPQLVVKEIKIAIRISDHDLETKVAQIRRQLNKNYTVKVKIEHRRIRGVTDYKPLQENMFTRVLEKLADLDVQKSNESWTGRRDLYCTLCCKSSSVETNS